MLVLKEQLLNVSSSDVKQHIKGIIEAGPTSQFNCQVITEFPDVFVYLIENNLSEGYFIFHVFSYDNVGKDYSYLCFPVNQIHRMHEFISKANLY